MRRSRPASPHRERGWWRVGPLWGLYAAVALAVPVPEVTQPQGDKEDAAVRDLLARMAEACGMVGKGTVRVLVVPVHLMSPQKKSEPTASASQTAPANESTGGTAEPGGGEVPKKVWIPNTIVEGKLTSAADLAYEIDRLREVTNSQPASQDGAPSPALLAFLEASQRNAKMQGPGAKSSPSPIGEHLGRGVPWRPVETIAPVGATRGAESITVQPEVESKRTGIGGPRALSRKLAKTSSPLSKSPQLATVQAKAPPHSGGAGKPEPSEPPLSGEGGYVAVVFRGPFQVFDERPGQTLLIELEGNQVGRIREQGKEWAWLQLDSGLMGVMRNKYLRSATPQEVRQFLDLEGLPQANQAGEDFQIGVIDLDSAALPIQSAAGVIPSGRKVGETATVPASGAGEPKALKPLR